MNRPSILHGSVLLAALAILTTPFLGCQAGLLTAMYLIKGTDVDPEFKELKEKKVAVVCHPVVSLEYRNANVGRNLSKEITRLIQEKVPKIETVDQRKVAEWLDENTWDEYVEVGRAMKADLVVGIDLESFSVLEGQTLYQGKANATIRVFDCTSGELVFEKILPRSVYPPNVAVPASDRDEPAFRREFIKVLADQIARHFYAHDPHADMAMDAKAYDQ